MSRSSIHAALSRSGDSLENAASELWKLDSNRLRPGDDYSLNFQSRSRGYSHDAARVPLFEHMSDEVWSRPTYAAFRKLLDNYTVETGIPEKVSREEQGEEQAFLDVICDTPVMQFTYKWLCENSPMRADTMLEFKQMLHDIWFKLYRRDASRDSSGFEHVFCGEIDDGRVKGMHNFIQVYIEEIREHFDYSGYLPVRGSRSKEAPPPEQQLVTIRFEWMNEIKPASSMFVGVSPEFEVALYTLIFIAGEQDVVLDLGPYNVRVKVYQKAGKIGTAYPDLLSVDEGALLVEPEEPAVEVEAPAEVAPAVVADSEYGTSRSEGFSYLAALQRSED